MTDSHFSPALHSFANLLIKTLFISVFPLIGFSLLMSAVPANATAEHVVVISVDGSGWEQYWKNPSVKIPTIRALAEKGAVGPMEASFPSLTWVSHTSMVTGAFPRETGVLGNAIFNRSLGVQQSFYGDDVFNKDDIVKVKTIYDLVKDRDPTSVTAAISWPLTRGSESLDYIVPESLSQATYNKYSKPFDFLAELARNDIPTERWGAWSALPQSYREDWLTASTAKYLIKTKKPNLLLVHFLVTDSFSHLYGAGSTEGIWAHEYVDGLIKGIVDSITDAGLLDSTTFFIVSDHGFTNVHKSIKPNVLLKLRGLIRVDRDGVVLSEDAITVMNHGCGFVYVLNLEKRDQIIREIKPLLAGLEGVKAVYGVDDFDKLGLPTPVLNPQMPDLVVMADEGYMITEESDLISLLGDAHYSGTHGHDPQEPWMKALFIASGANIARGVKLTDVTVRDIAPTIARLFNTKMPATWPGQGGKYRAGRVLTEILDLPKDPLEEFQPTIP
ncbi:MAG: alkaline phosphatase family protein [Proteobacteria bacterium]|nr:alkaline phosphatase family protein [Pseudomonadota bacterium]